MLKPLMIRSTLAALVCSVSFTAHAMADAPKRIDVPPGELVVALEMLSRQAAVDLVFQPDQLKSFRTEGVNGTYSPQDAIRILLKGTPLQLRTDAASGAMVIASPPGAPKSTSRDSSTSATPRERERRSSSFWSRLHLAQSDPSERGGPDEIGTGNDVNTADAAGGSQKNPLLLEEIVVTGSRIARATQQDAQPLQIYTSEQVERSGQSTLVDFLGSLPQVSVQSVPGNIQVFASQRSVRLHGLPLGSTLVLLDGYRVQTSRYGLFDLSVVPTAAVERIEVLPVGSSAIYGSDALAGVVNLILRKDFEGLEINGKYGFADGTDDRMGSFALGGVRGRASFSLIGSFQKQSELQFAEREISSRGNYTDLGGADYTVDQCGPGNVYSLNGQNLPGLNSPRAAIPAGIQGGPTLADFQATSGQIRRCNPNLRFAAIPATQQEGGLASLRYELTPATEVFFETLYSHFNTATVIGNLINLAGGSTGSFVVGAANPFNPFGVNVGVSYTYEELPRNNERTQTFVRPLLGVRGELPGEWRWEVSGLYSYDDFRVLSQSVNAGAIRQALASSDPATALNVFAAGAPGSAGLLSTLTSEGHNRFYNSLASGQAIVRGPLLDLPAGPLQVVVGGEYERVRQWDQLVGSAAAERRRRAYAAFTEARVPILAGESAAQAGEKLALSLALRYDESDDFGGKATGQAGLEWRPHEGLLVRGTYGTSYRAPELSELFGVTPVFSGTVTDPFRGNRTYTFLDYQPGPNPDLKAETGHSHSFGLVYSTPALANLETSLTYWSVAYRDYIAMPTINDVVTHSQSYPSAVIVRGAPSAQDIANGHLGPITSLRVGFSNFGAIDVSGVDLTAGWRLSTRLGSFKPSLAATYTYEYDAALTPGVPQESYVSQAATSPGFAPRWKGTASLAWELGGLSASLAGRYVGPYNDYTNFIGAQPHELGDFWLCDATLRYNLPAGALGASVVKNAYITVGGVNIFNNLPQFSYFRLTGYDFSQSDIRGRFVYAQIGMRF